MHCTNLLLLLISAGVLERIDAKIVFTAVKQRSVSAPVAIETTPSNNRLNCAEMCTKKSNCFGFNWLKGLCRVFDLSAFFSDVWERSDECDVYTMKSEMLTIAGCNQSSDQGGHVCERAIDGNKNPNLYYKSCSHTVDGYAGWWEAHLAVPALISYVTIYNRQDCCGGRLRNVNLLVDGVVCNVLNLAETYKIGSFSCNAFGSTFRIAHRSSQSLNICELELYTIVN